jgi:hypothetical protein
MALSTTIQSLVPPAKKFNKSWWSMRLGEYLRSVNVSQRRFAAQIGVRQATVSRYISGEQIPSTPLVLKIRDLSKGAVALDDWAPEKRSGVGPRCCRGSELPGDRSSPTTPACLTSHRAHCPLFTVISGSLALQAALANRRLIRITVFYGPAALFAKGLAVASLPMVVASTL